MILDTSTAFGHHRPGFFGALLIALAQRAPHNWLGQQIAQVARKLILLRGKLPLDMEVGPIRMRCYLKDNNSEKKFVFMPWRFDPIERNLLLQVLPADGTFLDIGANVGIYSLCAATHLNASGRVIALEPNPPAFAHLCYNLEATRAVSAAWPRVDALQFGVSDVVGEVELHLDAQNLGGNSIHQRRVAVQSGGIVRVLCKPLLLILNDLGVSKVDALKIDIEGAEDLALVPFLRDAPDELLPAYIFMENYERLWKLDLAGALAWRGYQMSTRAKGNSIYHRAALSSRRATADS